MARNEASVSVALATRDRGHVEKLARDIGYAGPLRIDGPREQQRRDGFIVHGTGSVRLTLNSMHLCGALIALGITPRKSLTVRPWDGPPSLLRHFFRGAVDGDGSLIRGSNGNWSISLVGSRWVCEAFATFIREQTGIQMRAKPHHSIWDARVGGRLHSQAIARLLYDGATIYLDRKMERARMLMDGPADQTGRFPHAPSAATVAKAHTPEALAKLSASRRAYEAAHPRAPISEETRAKLRAAHRGRTFSPETCAKISAAKLAYYAAKRAGLPPREPKGRDRRRDRPSAETIARRLATRIAHGNLRNTPATRAKMSASKKGKSFSAAHRAALSTAHTGLTQSAETIRKRAASMRATWAAKRRSSAQPPLPGL